MLVINIWKTNRQWHWQVKYVKYEEGLILSAGIDKTFKCAMSNAMKSYKIRLKLNYNEN